MVKISAASNGGVAVDRLLNTRGSLAEHERVSETEQGRRRGPGPGRGHAVRAPQKVPESLSQLGRVLEDESTTLGIHSPSRGAAVKQRPYPWHVGYAYLSGHTDAFDQGSTGHMGLAGRKTKQRIPNDPRNLAWANDANKFGAAYLAKLGWDPSQGLGASGEGRTKAISVTQKLDMLGIGADHRNTEEGIAWKQNKDFENLLKRLNAANGSGTVEEENIMKVDGFVRAGPEAGAQTVYEDKEEEKVDETAEAEDGEKKSKKKRKKDVDGEEGEERKKKRKKSKSSEDQSDAETDKKKDRKKKKRRDASEGTMPAPKEAVESPAPAAVASVLKPAPVVQPKARLHRARHMAAKNLASKSASAIAEILGVAPDPSPSTSGFSTPFPGALSSGHTTSALSTPCPSTPYEPGPATSASPSPSGGATPAAPLEPQELTVSSKSVMDYFKEKLAAKSGARTPASSRAATPAVAPAPAAQAGEEMDDYADRPRAGLGAARARVETRSTRTVEEVREERTGLGGIGSGARAGFAAMFAKASTTTVESTFEDAAAVSAKVEVMQEDEAPKKSKDKERKREKKDKKGKGKEKAAEVEAEVKPAVADGADEEDAKAERKRRKEEKRRRKAAEVAGSGAQGVPVEDAPEAESKERKRKDKKKSKGES
ncbi:hypothetical protein BD413DRAFT_639888 [Trametes elegans]|nr:hypothetical protein BD413DRAFT_639888 [Trametes elegans]